MSANRADHTVKMMCEVLKLSRTGYYKWLKRGESEHERRDLELVDQILHIRSGELCHPIGLQRLSLMLLT